MPPLNVLYFIDSLDSGGAQRQMSHLVSRIDRSQVRPTLAVYRPDASFAAEVSAAGVPVIALGGRGGKDPRVMLRLARLLRSGRFDLVHALLRGPGLLARLATLPPLPRSIPVIVSERDVFLGRSRARLWLERRLCRRADALIVNSDCARRHVERLVPGWRGRSHLVPNGVRLDPLDATERATAQRLRADHATPGSRLLGVVARIDRNKGPDLVADALRALEPRIARRLSVVWMGKPVDPAAVAPLRALSRSRGDLAAFALLPAQPNTRPLLAAVDGLLLASRAESMPNAVLEACAMSRPVLASDVGDVARVVVDGKSGWLLPPGDGAALGHAIAAFVDVDRERLVVMGAEGRRRVAADYRLEFLCQRTLAVYRQVVAEFIR